MSVEQFDRISVSNISQEYADGAKVFNYRYIGMTANKKKFIAENTITGDLETWAYIHAAPTEEEIVITIAEPTKDKRYRIKSYSATMKALAKRGFVWDDDADGFVSPDYEFVFASDSWTFCGMKVSGLDYAASMGFPNWLVTDNKKKKK